MTEYSDSITAIESIIKANLTEYEQVNHGFGLDFEGVLQRVATSDKAIFINYESASVDEHFGDGSFADWEDTISVYLKHTSNILTKTKAFFAAFNGKNLYKETNVGPRQIRIVDWQPVQDDNFDIMQIRLEVL